MNWARRIVLGLLAVVLTGALLVLALPLGERPYLVWFALVPLLLATRERGFLLGFLAGLASAGCAAWLSADGIFYAERITGEVGMIYGSYAKYAFAFAVDFAFWGEPGTRRLPAWWFAALATLLEASLLFLIPAHLALSQYRQAFWVQTASVGGVWLVSFAIWWTDFALAESIARRRLNPFLALPLVALFLGGVWLPIGGPVRRLGAVQIGEPEEDALRRLHREATDDGATLVVWPEFAGIAFVRAGDTSALRKVGGAPFVTSFPDAFRPLPHNAAALFALGRESRHYDKRKLFGGEVNMHAPGDRAVAVDGVGLNICFDSCFPEIIRETALQGGDVVAVPTEDPESSNDFLAAMHAAYTPFRAAESGVVLVRSDATRSSMVVDPRGRIVAEQLAGDGVVVADTPVGPRWTPFRALGNWFLWLCGALVFAGWLRERRSRAP